MSTFLKSRLRFATPLSIDISIFAASILPFLVLPHLPLGDWFNHLARQYIIANLGNSSHFQEFYAFEWGFVPNLGFDIFVQTLRSVFGIEIAARLFFVVSFAMLFFGGRSIAILAADPPSRWYRTIPLIFYAGPVQLGFLSYLLSIGLAVACFSAFARWYQRPTVAGWCLLAVASAIIITAHLGGYLIYLTIIASYLAFIRFRDLFLGQTHWRDWLADALKAAHLLVALVPMLLTAVPSAESHGDFAAMDWVLWRKIESFASITMFSFPIVEILIGVTFAVILFALILRGGASIRFDLFAPVIGLAALTLAIPSHGMGGGTYGDYRVPMVAFVLAVAALRPAHRPAPERPLLWRAAAIAIGAIVALRISLAAAQWWSWQGIYEEFEGAIRQLPESARVFTVHGTLPSASESVRPPVLHAPAISVYRRSALYGNLFADLPSHHLLRVLPNNGNPKTSVTGSVFNTDSINNYDFLFVIDPATIEVTGARPRTVIARGSRFILYRLSRE